MNSKELLLKYRTQHSQIETASVLGVNVRTVRRWETGDSPPPNYLGDALRLQMQKVPKEHGFRMIDLFAGIGGTRLGFPPTGGRCVFTAEWDKFARLTYSANFSDGEDHLFAHDITKVEAGNIPDHDLLLAGFPCQPFSIAGVSKKNSLGRSHGFEDSTQGTLFFDIARILAEKRPPVFLLEGSIASTATRSPSLIISNPSLSIKVLFPTPGMPVIPILNVSLPEERSLTALSSS